MATYCIVFSAFCRRPPWPCLVVRIASVAPIPRLCRPHPLPAHHPSYDPTVVFHRLYRIGCTVSRIRVARIHCQQIIRRRPRRRPPSVSSIQFTHDLSPSSLTHPPYLLLSSIRSTHTILKHRSRAPRSENQLAYSLSFTSYQWGVPA